MIPLHASSIPDDNYDVVAILNGYEIRISCRSSGFVARMKVGSVTCSVVDCGPVTLGGVTAMTSQNHISENAII